MKPRRRFVAYGKGYSGASSSLERCEARVERNGQGEVFVSLDWLTRFLQDGGYGSHAQGMGWRQFGQKYGVVGSETGCLLEKLYLAMRGT